jgi:hypothetical protein
MRKSRTISRWVAAGIHLCITAAVAIPIGVLLFGVWYPPPYFGACGADRLLLLMLGVALILGPLLTLIVFKAGKWGMTFDLAVIACVQLLALAYGLQVTAKSRPIFLVGAIDRFIVASSDMITDADLAKGSQPEFRSRSWTGARLAGARIADDKARERLVEAAMAGLDIQSFPEDYVPYDVVAGALAARGKSLDQLRARPGAASLVDAWLAASHREPDSVVWVPVVARTHDLAMLLDRNTGVPLQALQIDPW